MFKMNLKLMKCIWNFIFVFGTEARFCCQGRVGLVRDGGTVFRPFRGLRVALGYTVLGSISKGVSGPIAVEVRIADGPAGPCLSSP